MYCGKGVIFVLSLKKKKWVVFASVLCCVVFSVCLSVLQFSSTNLGNVVEDRETVSFSAENEWQQEEQGSVVLDEAQNNVTVQCDQPLYVQNVLIDGEAEGELVTVKLSYTASADKPEEVQSIEVPVELKNNDIYLEVEAEVSEMKVELRNENGAGIHSVSGITLNPRKLNVNYQGLLLSFLLPLSVALLVIEVFCDKEGFRKMVVSLKKYRCLLTDLVSRDLKTKYRRSVLGILWSVLNPLFMMLVLTAIFSTLMRFNTEDVPYSIYYLTGYLMFNFLSESTNFSLVSIIHSAGLIKKVYIPKIIFPLEKCLFSLVNFGFSLIAAVIVFLVVGITPHWTIVLFFIPVVYLFIFSFGFSLILATLNTFFRDVGYLYNVFVSLWMYLTPIIYPIKTLPEWMQGIVRVNPLTHYVEYFRSLTIYGVVPGLEENLICLSYSLIFLCLGVMVFQKNQNKFIFYV